MAMAIESKGCDDCGNQYENGKRKDCFVVCRFGSSWIPIEPPKEPKKDCRACKFSEVNSGTPCRELIGICKSYSKWQPNFTPKPAEKLWSVSNPDYWNCTKAGSGHWTDISSLSKTDKPLKKAKENKMWNKLRNKGRRITMAWDLFGIYLLCKLVNPWVCKAWFSLGDWSNATSTDKAVVPWIMTITSIAAILGALYGLDRLAAWWYGEKK